MLGLLENAAALAPPKRKTSLFPVLVVLFLISYGLMTLLIVEQGRTIDSQRYLIRQLLDDSGKLASLQGQIAQQQHRAKPQPPARNRQQAPSSQAQSQTQKQSYQAGTPLSQVSPSENTASAESGGKARARKRALPKPPQTGADTPDERRLPSFI